MGTLLTPRTDPATATEIRPEVRKGMGANEGLAGFGPDVILLGLNATLSDNFREVMPQVRGGRPFADVTEETETYRQWLADLLLATGFAVLLVTVRAARWRDVTIRWIREKTGGVPTKSYFNSSGTRIPHLAKQAMLGKLILPAVPRESLIAFESNERKRKMFRGRGIGSSLD